jgi:hypothetical protein
MQIRKVVRWAVLGGIAVGLLAVANMPAAPADEGDGGFRLTAGSPGASPVGADRLPAGKQTAVKPGPTKAPATAKPLPDNTLIQAVVGPSRAGNQTAVANCPVGTRVLAGGGRVIDGRGLVLLYELRPIGSGTANDPDRFIASAAVRQPAQPSGSPGFGRGLRWSVEAYAVCGPALPGYMRIQSAVEGSLGSRLTATVRCPTGRKVIGVGGSVDGGRNLGAFAVGEMFPDPTGTVLTVTGTNDRSDREAVAGTQIVDAIAICASTPIRYQVVSRSTAFRGGNHTVDAPCPTGTKMYGSGMSKRGDEANHAYVDTVLPEGSSRSNPNPRFVRVAAQQSPATQELSLRAFAICAA